MIRPPVFLFAVLDISRDEIPTSPKALADATALSLAINSRQTDGVLAPDMPDDPTDRIFRRARALDAHGDAQVDLSRPRAKVVAGLFRQRRAGALGGAGFERIGAEAAEPGTALGQGLGAEAALNTRGKYLGPILLNLGWRRRRLYRTLGPYSRF